MQYSVANNAKHCSFSVHYFVVLSIVVFFSKHFIFSSRKNDHGNLWVPHTQNVLQHNLRDSKLKHKIYQIKTNEVDRSLILK